MNVLFDTHIVLWCLNDDAKLPKTAASIIDNEANAIYFSTVSMWEITIKHSLKPLSMRTTGEEFFNLCIEAGFYD